MTYSDVYDLSWSLEISVIKPNKVKENITLSLAFVCLFEAYETHPVSGKFLVGPHDVRLDSEAGATVCSDAGLYLKCMLTRT